MSLSKQSRSSGAGSSGGYRYEVLQSEAQKIVFRVYSFFQKMHLKMNKADLISWSVKT
jgi:hypothetical protein